jgi:hypothetical protein
LNLSPEKRKREPEGSRGSGIVLESISRDQRGRGLRTTHFWNSWMGRWSITWAKIVLPLFMLHCRGREAAAVSVPDGPKKIPIENASVPPIKLIPEELLRRRKK